MTKGNLFYSILFKKDKNRLKYICITSPVQKKEVKSRHFINKGSISV